ncbi:hypothetical protein PG988_000455 [Apiospora saccharicola]
MAGGFDEDEDEEVTNADDGAAAADPAAGASAAEGDNNVLVEPEPEIALEGEDVKQKKSTHVNKMDLNFILN